jgi:predicted ATPase
MRLKHVYVSKYKNLKDFTLNFNGESFIDIFVGKNGSGKSNLLEALIEIFRHLYEQGSPCGFDYKIRYLLGDEDIVIEWKQEKFYLNNGMRGVKTFSTTPLPDNVLIYYSGHNNTVSNLIDRYEVSFKKKIRGANIGDSRKFIGIGPDCKSLLLSVLLLQSDTCTAKVFICNKLGIKAVSDTIQVELKRPKFAEGRLKELKTKAIEDFDPRTHYWGADGITGEFLEKLKGCIKGEFNHSTIYDSDRDSYSIPVNIELFQQVFEDRDISDQFRLLDNLKTLDMLGDINIAITLIGGSSATMNYFSDGQLQSVYIYAVTEIFKDKESIILLDEPDSFLHPEWQFDFLKQVFEISEKATKTNHILMSSHSASTITSADEDTISLFDLDGGNAVVNKVSKSEVIKSLSAGLISFTEGEAQLNINHNLKNTSGPVLFVEGITDEIILETAWRKLYPDRERPFIVQSAFCRSILYSLFSDDQLRVQYKDRLMFGLFDFDEAYDDWNGLKPPNVSNEQDDPFKGLAKKLNHPSHYAMLLPVPENDDIKPQVLNENGEPWGRGVDSHLSIKLLFYRDNLLGRNFKKKATPGGGEIVEFIGKKTKFANNTVPQFGVECFEIFKPIFEFMESKTLATEEPKQETTYAN